MKQRSHSMHLRFSGLASFSEDYMTNDNMLSKITLTYFLMNSSQLPLLQYFPQYSDK